MSVLDLTALRLRVRDRDRMATFYRDVLGFTVADGAAVLDGRRVVVELAEDVSAPIRPYPCPGLYHFALLVPDREALGRIFRRVVEVRHPFEGMADHGVSEALYLRDPEMNGIELYWDRPRDAWPFDDTGQLAMGADPLDTDGLAAAGGEPGPLHPDTRLGHVHMHVTSLEAAEDFYAGALGLAVTQRSYRGALFFAAGDYHHHVAANVWAPDRAVPPDATGMESYTVRLAPADLESLAVRLEDRAVPYRQTPTGLALTDPAGIGVLIEPA